MNETTESTPSSPTPYLIGEADEGLRLDVYVNERAGWNSRSRIKEAIKLGTIRVNDRTTKPSYRLRVRDRVSVLSEPPPPPDYLLPETMPLGIIYEDASLVVINKQPYLAVHPGAGKRTGTLANGLAGHFQALSDVGGALRPGIVHRLDQDTSGVMVVAKTNRAHYAITTQFHARTVQKTYHAIVEGRMEFDEYEVDKPIGRHPSRVGMMTVDDPGGRPAYTRFRVLERFENYTLVRCFPKTGRTHQIRVHLRSLGHPILCDRRYGRRYRITYGEILSLGPDDPSDRTLLDRQALHASSLEIFHPLQGERMVFEAPFAPDIQAVLDALRETRGGSSSRLM